jgi:hypothetical protein
VADRYITVTEAPTSSAENDSPQTESSPADDSTSTDQSDNQTTTLPDSETPLADTATADDEKGQGNLPVILSTLLVFVALVIGGWFFLWRTHARRGQYKGGEN